MLLNVAILWVKADNNNLADCTTKFTEKVVFIPLSILKAMIKISAMLKVNKYYKNKNYF